MPHAPVLVVGATGTVGRPVVRGLRQAGVPVRSAARSASGQDAVRLDLTDPATWDAAFTGVRTMFLVRPPQLGNVRRDVVPALERARGLGVEHVVLLSVQGADRMPMIPHAVLERWLRESGMGWTFVRPAWFDQNLTGVFAADIRERHELMAPCGDARMAVVDAEDVAAVAVAALLDPAAHDRRAWTPSAEALDWHEMAAILTAELGVAITYRRPSVPRYLVHARRDLGMGTAEALVTAAIHASARLGHSAGLTDDVRTVTGRDPVTLREFVARERATWLGAAGRP